ncbi:Fatty acid hydroxylase domain-containing protein 2 [Hondaea fermentalgiana]|uniref:Fatty acid hydroxylase domain-containing protein 2 n=1 Tax=Hondaea fermentalgiana TaxID=2315210 RepID=A0A2R5GPP9_9STRA|nr:Fatty acid hydroxylase domain-containing protein 2 [Hondaea fermentalgiana]|eukprot:GBG32595.1 Fatty acid hydroxylase domain-containing protein 2 [Hondaea fermentalgiana]
MADTAVAAPGLLGGLRTAEQKAALVLAAVTVAYGFKSAEAVRVNREREIVEHPKTQRTPSAEKVQDHPVAAWVLTNASVWTTVLLKFKLGFGLENGDTFWKAFFKQWAGNVVTVDGSMAINWFLINKVYAHVPFFTHKRLKQTYTEILMDYIKCNTVVNVIGATVQSLIFLYIKNGKVTGQGEPWRPLRFLMRLIYMRVIVDAGFWIGHRWLHRKDVYAWAHRTHHEHSATQLTTNYHFEWHDLLIEAFIPFIVGVAVHDTFFTPLDGFDMSLLGTYIFWHEIESHAGKPMPTMPLVAPLSTWTQRFDDWNSWFHEVHHRTLKFNLSISPWFDCLMKTHRWDL